MDKADAAQWTWGWRGHIGVHYYSSLIISVHVIIFIIKYWDEASTQLLTSLELGIPANSSVGPSSSLGTSAGKESCPICACASTCQCVRGEGAGHWASGRGGSVCECSSSFLGPTSVQKGLVGTCKNTQDFNKIKVSEGYVSE